MAPVIFQPCEIPIILSSVIPTSCKASIIPPNPCGSTPIRSNKPECSTCATSSATSVTSSPICFTNVKSPSFAKSLNRGASVFRLSITDGWAQACVQSIQRCVCLCRPSTASPNRSSRPPPSMPISITSHSSIRDSSVRPGTDCTSQKSAPAHRSERRFIPISTFRCLARKPRMDSSPSFSAFLNSRSRNSRSTEKPIFGFTIAKFSGLRCSPEAIMSSGNS